MKKKTTRKYVSPEKYAANFTGKKVLEKEYA